MFITQTVLLFGLFSGKFQLTIATCLTVIITGKYVVITITPSIYKHCAHSRGAVEEP